ncbi:MAG: T9SS type A sorting domain-containing protein [Bacteroidales bacterium]|nr:T9SS type A sorting domain-containing protein [Bacteroidales bacterium]MCF8458819.1 T9SS type A sorting domain-containing protein [Bacteroidales bacterium]
MLQFALITDPIFVIDRKHLSNINKLPNPANDKLYIDLCNKSGRDLKSHSDWQPTVELINTNGQVILEKEIGNLQKIEFDISHLPAGEYFVRVIVKDEQVFVEKVVK